MSEGSKKISNWKAARENLEEERCRTISSVCGFLTARKLGACTVSFLVACAWCCVYFYHLPPSIFG